MSPVNLNKTFDGRDASADDCPAVPADVCPAEKLRLDILACRSCPLSETVTNKVIMKGSLRPKIVFIGEAPGKNEDLTGIPFCGRAGKLLDEMISFMDLSEDDWAVINTVKCRPPGNRVPSVAELRACRPFFEAQLKLLSPQLIILLGNTAEKAFGIAETHGWGVPFTDPEGRTILKIFHPAALIYRRDRIPEQYAFLDANRHLWERSLNIFRNADNFIVSRAASPHCFSALLLCIASLHCFSCAALCFPAAFRILRTSKTEIFINDVRLHSSSINKLIQMNLYSDRILKFQGKHDTRSRQDSRLRHQTPGSRVSVFIIGFPFTVHFIMRLPPATLLLS